jgi:hypothetical protein
VRPGGGGAGQPSFFAPADDRLPVTIRPMSPRGVLVRAILAFALSVVAAHAVPEPAAPSPGSPADAGRLADGGNRAASAAAEGAGAGGALDQSAEEVSAPGEPVPVAPPAEPAPGPLPSEPPAPSETRELDSPLIRWLESLSAKEALAWLGSADGTRVLLRALLGLGIFVVGWLLAHLLASGVRRLVTRILTDPRLVVLLDPDARPSMTSDPRQGPERLVSRIAFVLAMLVVLLAVLHFGGLREASEPLDRLARALAYALPLVGRSLVILGVCYVAARVLSRAVVRGLRGLSLDARWAGWSRSLAEGRPGAPAPAAAPTEGREGDVPVSEQAGRITFWLVVAFGLAAAIESLEFLPLGRPIRSALESVIAFLPSLGAAVLIVIGGVLLGRLVRHIVRNLLQSLAFDALMRRLQVGRLAEGTNASALAGSVAMVIVIVQAGIAALDQLGLTTLSMPLTAMVTQVWSAVPRIVLGVIFLLLGHLLARGAHRWMEGLLTRLHIDEALARIGISGTRALTPSRLLAGFGRVLVLLLAAQQAFIAMELHSWGEDVSALLRFLVQNVGLAALIVVIGFAVGQYVRDLIVARRPADAEGTQWLADLVRAGVLVFAFTMAIHHVGIAERFVTIAFAFVFGALCLALALALGLGGRELAAELLQNRFGKERSAAPPEGPPAGADSVENAGANGDPPA